MQSSVEREIKEGDLICPITHECFVDPVIVSDGHVYEREAITRWIRQNGTSPFTRQQLSLDDIRTERRIKRPSEGQPVATVSSVQQNRIVTLPPLRIVVKNNTRVSPMSPSPNTLDPIPDQATRPVAVIAPISKCLLLFGIFSPYLLIIGTVIGITIWLTVIFTRVHSEPSTTTITGMFSEADMSFI
jgi:hypothetical protein